MNLKFARYARNSSATVNDGVIGTEALRSFYHPPPVPVRRVTTIDLVQDLWGDDAVSADPRIVDVAQRWRIRRCVHCVFFHLATVHTRHTRFFPFRFFVIASAAGTTRGRTAVRVSNNNNNKLLTTEVSWRTNSLHSAFLKLCPATVS